MKDILKSFRNTGYAPYDAYDALRDSLPSLKGLSDADRETALDIVADMMWRQDGPLSNPTAIFWKELKSIDAETFEGLAHAVEKKFQAGIPLAYWTSVVFAFDEFEDTVQESIQKFLARDDALDVFQNHAAAMAEFVRFPNKVTAKTQKRYAELADNPVILSQVRRVVDYGAESIGTCDVAVDKAFVFLLSVSGEKQDEELLSRVWEGLSARPTAPKLSADQFESILAASGNLESLLAVVRSSNENRYLSLPSSQFLVELAGKEIDAAKLREAEFYLTVFSEDEKFSIVLRVYPGYGELVPNDVDADWAMDVWKQREGTHVTFTHAGRISATDFGIDVNPTKPGDFPEVMSAAATSLGTTWDVSTSGLKRDLRQKRIRVTAKKLVEWLG